MRRMHDCREDDALVCIAFGLMDLPVTASEAKILHGLSLENIKHERIKRLHNKARESKVTVTVQ